LRPDDSGQENFDMRVTAPGTERSLSRSEPSGGFSGTAGLGVVVRARVNGFRTHAEHLAAFPAEKLASTGIGPHDPPIDYMEDAQWQGFQDQILLAHEVSQLRGLLGYAMLQRDLHSAQCLVTPLDLIEHVVEVPVQLPDLVTAPRSASGRGPR
jgi:hypothetical protein